MFLAYLPVSKCFCCMVYRYATTTAPRNDMVTPDVDIAALTSSFEDVQLQDTYRIVIMYPSRKLLHSPKDCEFVMLDIDGMGAREALPQDSRKDMRVDVDDCAGDGAPMPRGTAGVTPLEIDSLIAAKDVLQPQPSAMQDAKVRNHRLDIATYHERISRKTWVYLGATLDYLNPTVSEDHNHAVDLREWREKWATSDVPLIKTVNNLLTHRTDFAYYVARNMLVYCFDCDAIFLGEMRKQELWGSTKVREQNEMAFTEENFRSYYQRLTMERLVEDMEDVSM